MVIFNNFWLCLLKLLVKVTAMSVKYLLRFLSHFLTINFFLICVYYVLSVLHASYPHVCFVNISAYILTEIPTRLSNLFYNNSFNFDDVNVGVEYATHSDLVYAAIS